MIRLNKQIFFFILYLPTLSVYGQPSFDQTYCYVAQHIYSSISPNHQFTLSIQGLENEEEDPILTMFSIAGKQQRILEQPLTNYLYAQKKSHTHRQ